MTNPLCLSSSSLCRTQMPRTKKGTGSSLLNETIASQENPKPRCVRFRKGAASGKCYAVGKTKMMGVHPFINRYLLKMLSGTTASELKVIANRPCASFVDIDADEKQRGPPQRNKFAIGTRVHRQWKRTVKSLIKRKTKVSTKAKKVTVSAAPRIHPWIRTILSLIRQPAPRGLGYEIIDAEKLVAWKEARVGTELDGVGLDPLYEGRAIVVFELKTTKTPGYATVPVYEFTREFCRLAGITKRQGLTQLEADMLQALCGKVLLKEFAKRWPSKAFPPDLKIADVLVIHSVTPKQADAYRVPRWMAEMTPALIELMRTVMKDKPLV